MRKQTLIIVLSMVIGVMVFSSNVSGAVKTWIGTTSTSWNTANNWNPVGVPGSGDDVVFDGTAIRNCFLDISTSIKSLLIFNDYGYQITFPSGKNLSIEGDIYIDAPAMPWLNNSNIILTGPGIQNITIIDPVGDYSFYDLTINKPSGSVILNSDIIITGTFTIISGSINCNGFSGPCPPPCTPPVTGGIYHIANDFAL